MLRHRLARRIRLRPASLSFECYNKDMEDQTSTLRRCARCENSCSAPGTTRSGCMRARRSRSCFCSWN